ncbi:alpha/beta hydrolase [Paenibacillus sp. LHD-38]|uniref:alpha/beta hydrolase n=1 Tax=Paenibacillus sp. LHD-38 TaxID=3072143 RepID=UPI00280C5EC4|nr:alpha/beta hydrolase [Paenibacillus sp. LHD-38]MDQ8735609.1 alpha/beta hydrolase [Paenibacillus sp. LHD-38]
MPRATSNEMMQLRQRMQQMMQMQGMTKSVEKIDYALLRETMNAASERMPSEPGVTFTSEDLNGVEVELSTPNQMSGDDIIIYLHGGGFTCGNARASRGFASQLAGETGLRVYSVSYRLAPEHPYPAAPDDCFTVYIAILSKYPGIKISLIGDSAGANLSLVTTLRAMDAGIPLPTSITLYSPPADVTGKIDRTRFSATDFIIGAELESEIRALYFPNNNPDHPYISPLYGNFEGFPPLKIVTDSTEVLADDADLLAEKAQMAGVQVDYQKWDGTFHAFATTGRGTPESLQVLQETAQFIKKHF